MSEQHGYMKALKCRECGREYPLEATHVCEFDFGPLEVAYDYDRIKKSLTREAIAVAPENDVALPRAAARRQRTDRRQASRLHAARQGRPPREGARHPRTLVKNDAVNYPTLSFKDRVVSVALSRAKELGFDTVACASTGNLANSVSAQAASAGLKSYVFIPSDLEQGKILNSLIYGANVIAIKGHYDEVNRLCAEIAGKFGWAFVNVNMRPYYAEGSKSMAYEIAEQLGWRAAAAHHRADGVRLAAHENSQGLSGICEARPRRRHASRTFTARRRPAVRRFPSRKRPDSISSSR